MGIEIGSGSRLLHGRPRRRWRRSSPASSPTCASRSRTRSWRASSAASCAQWRAACTTWPRSPTTRSTRIAAVDYRTHFESVYHLYSYATNTYLELHVAVPRAKASVETVCDIWPAADWHEREAWDMMGIRYEGHPDLRRILLKDDWIGHPLRKDYVDLAENHPNV